MAAHLEAGGATAGHAMEQAQALLYSQLLRQSSMLAFVDVFWLLGATCLAMIPLMFLMKKRALTGALYQRTEATAQARPQAEAHR